MGGLGLPSQAIDLFDQFDGLLIVLLIDSAKVFMTDQTPFGSK